MELILRVWHSLLDGMVRSAQQPSSCRSDSSPFTPQKRPCAELSSAQSPWMNPNEEQQVRELAPARAAQPVPLQGFGQIRRQPVVETSIADHGITSCRRASQRRAEYASRIFAAF